MTPLHSVSNYLSCGSPQVKDPTGLNPLVSKSPDYTQQKNEEREREQRTVSEDRVLEGRNDTRRGWGEADGATMETSCLSQSSLACEVCSVRRVQVRRVQICCN